MLFIYIKFIYIIFYIFFNNTFLKVTSVRWQVSDSLIHSLIHSTDSFEKTDSFKNANTVLLRDAQRSTAKVKICIK